MTQKLKKPIHAEDAWKIGEYYRSMGVPTIAPSSAVYDILKNLTLQYKVVGVHVFDALLVATMIEHQIDTLYTANMKDLAQYKEIRVVNPLS